MTANTSDLFIHMPYQVASVVVDAMEEVPYLLAHAENIFEFLHHHAVDGGLKDHGWISILEMIRRGYADAVNKEGVNIDKATGYMRAAISQSAQKHADLEASHQRARDVMVASPHSKAKPKPNAEKES